MFEGVVRLPPAHAMVVGDDGAIRRRWRYWTPDYRPIEDGYDEAAAVQRFRELLEQSVRMRLRSDVAVGTSLSGGLDSSTIVCLLAEARMHTPTLTQNTFSGRFDQMDPTLSEGPYIDLVVERAGVDAHGVTPTPLGLIEESERLHWHQEEPFLSASIYLQWCVMRLAHEHRTTVLLDGQGADELLAGYQFYFPAYQLDLVDRWRFGRLAYDTVLFRRRLHRASRGYADSLRRFNHDVALGPRVLARSWRSRSSVFAGPYDVGVPEAVPGMRLRRQIAEALQYNSLPMLLRYADRNAMAFSRETRFPFLDHELVDWCVRLPDRAFIRDGWQKHILRQATRDILPPEIRLRADKVGYAAPLDLWLRGSLRDWAHDRLFGGTIVDLDGYDRTGPRGSLAPPPGRREQLLGPVALDQPERVVRAVGLRRLAARADAASCAERGDGGRLSLRRVLVLYWYPKGTDMRLAVRQHLHVLDGRGGQALYHNAVDPVPPWLVGGRRRISASCTRPSSCVRWNDDFERYRQPLRAGSPTSTARRSPSRRTSTTTSAVLEEWLLELGATSVYSCFGSEQRATLYPQLEQPSCRSTRR